MRTARPLGILVPLDGSALAEQALWVAARLARHVQGVLHIVTVRVPAPLQDDQGKRQPAHPPAGPDIRAGQREYLEGKAEEMSTTHGVRSATAVVDGWPPTALAEYVCEHDIAFVVMTAHGQSGVSRRWIGSVTEGLLVRVDAPVLVLRPGLAPARARFCRILVAIDGSVGSEVVLAKATALGLVETGTEYTLARIVEPAAPPLSKSPARPSSRSNGPLRRERDEASQDLERRAERLRKRGCAVRTEVVVAEAVAEGLIELATTLDCDLVAVGTRSPRTKEPLQLGSVADKVIRGANQPVLIIPVRKRSARRRRTGQIRSTPRQRAKPAAI